MSRWRVGIVGPGRAGTVVAAALARARHRVVAVAGGSPRSRDRLRSRLPTARDAPVDRVAADCDLVVVAVSDDALEQVVEAMAAGVPLGGIRIVHLSGARGLAPLAPAAAAGAAVAACHPAVTFPDALADPEVLVGMPWAVTVGDGDRGWARRLVEDTGGDAVVVADADRATYHAGLAVASNAVGAALALARELLGAAGVEEPGRFLLPLADASARNAVLHGRAGVTGPVVRGDADTIARHLQSIDDALVAAHRAAMRLVLEVAPPTDAARRRGVERVLDPLRHPRDTASEDHT